MHGMSEATTNKYVLIEHGHGPEDPAKLTICKSIAQLKRMTAQAIYGDEYAACPECEVLDKNGIVHFEGDPPVEWLIVSEITNKTDESIFRFTK